MAKLNALDRKRMADAELSELKLKEAKGILVRTGDVSAGMTSMLAVLRLGINRLVTIADASKHEPSVRFVALMEAETKVLFGELEEAAKAITIRGPGRAVPQKKAASEKKGKSARTRKTS